MSGPSIEYAAEGGVATLTINQPAKLNAMTYDMWLAVPGCVAKAEADRAVRVIVVTGAGEKAFCAGADISQFGEKRTGEEAVKAYEAAVTAGMKAISDAKKPTVARIRGFAFGGGMALAMCTDLPIPRLEELLASFPDVRINIDPKHDDSVEPLARAILDAGAVDRVCIGAFSDQRIDAMRQLCGPDLCTSMGPRRVARLVAATKPGVRRIGSPRFAEGAAQVPLRQGRMPLVTRSLVEGAHRLGVEVHVWTIDDPDEMRTLLDLGVDGIMTDQPAVLKDVLAERGEWR